MPIGGDVGAGTGGLTTPNQIKPRFPDRFVDQTGATMILM